VGVALPAEEGAIVELGSKQLAVIIRRSGDVVFVHTLSAFQRLTSNWRVHVNASPNEVTVESQNVDHVIVRVDAKTAMSRSLVSTEDCYRTYPLLANWLAAAKKHITSRIAAREVPSGAHGVVSAVKRLRSGAPVASSLLTATVPQAPLAVAPRFEPPSGFVANMVAAANERRAAAEARVEERDRCGFDALDTYRLALAERNLIAPQRPVCGRGAAVQADDSQGARMVATIDVSALNLTPNGLRKLQRDNINDVGMLRELLPEAPEYLTATSEGFALGDVVILKRAVGPIVVVGARSNKSSYDY
jgi:hypothetical protein